VLQDACASRKASEGVVGGARRGHPSRRGRLDGPRSRRVLERRPCARTQTKMDRTCVLQLYKRMLRPRVISREFLEATGLRLEDRVTSKRKDRFPRKRVAEKIVEAVREGFRNGRNVADREAQTKLLQGALNTYVLLQKAAYGDGLERALVQNALKVRKDQMRANRRPGRKKVLQAKESCKDTVELMWNAPWQQLCREYGWLTGSFFTVTDPEQG